MSPRNPTAITVAYSGETETVENVETWWYEETTLFVRHADDSLSRFPLGTVVK